MAVAERGINRGVSWNQSAANDVLRQRKYGWQHFGIVSSAPGFRWTSRWDITGVQTQEFTPMSNTPNFGERGRFSSQCKTAAVLRLFRGEDLELVSREIGVTAATLSGGRDGFLASAQGALKSRPIDDRNGGIARLRAKVGELTTENELVLHRCRAECPFDPGMLRP
jgi:hypothetical protein